MTVIFEPLIRTEAELTDVLEALQFRATELRELEGYAHGHLLKAQYAAKAARLDLLTRNLRGRAEIKPQQLPHEAEAEPAPWQSFEALDQDYGN